MHDVDEDLATVLAQGGRWDKMDIAGITQRDMNDIHSQIQPSVASSNMKN